MTTTVRLLVAVFMVALAPAGAMASGDSSAVAACEGVRVVVADEERCDTEGGRVAADHFANVGFELTFAAREAGFVCKINGSPADAGCVNASPANAYWGLFWARPGDGKWTFASRGVTNLTVPTGGAVAFAFQDGGELDPPAVPPSSGGEQAAMSQAGDSEKAPQENSTSVWPLIGGAALIVVIVVSAMKKRYRRSQ